MLYDCFRTLLFLISKSNEVLSLQQWFQGYACHAKPRLTKRSGSTSTSSRARIRLPSFIFCIAWLPSITTPPLLCKQRNGGDVTSSRTTMKPQRRPRSHEPEGFGAATPPSATQKRRFGQMSHLTPPSAATSSPSRRSTNDARSPDRPPDRVGGAKHDMRKPHPRAARQSRACVSRIAGRRRCGNVWGAWAAAAGLKRGHIFLSPVCFRLREGGD